MVEKIDQERWESAQNGEVEHYDYESRDNYFAAVDIILRHHFSIDIKNDLKGKTIVESGGGCYPAVFFCEGLKRAVNVEPLFDRFPDSIKEEMETAGVECISEAFEDVDTEEEIDEVWFFNVLQHVKDPYLQIEKARQIAKTIRLFEPIETAVNNEHPHTFTIEFFKEQFPDAEVKRYRGGSLAKFHGADCAYLTWSNPDEETN